MNYVPSSVKAGEWKISQRRVAILCKEGRIKGAELVGNRWLIPNDAQKPEDPRRVRKNGPEGVIGQTLRRSGRGGQNN